jgi:DNA-binding NarL/FixJ family response regulator
MKTKNPINIFIVEDNEVFALALKANIETSFAKQPIKLFSFETGEAMQNYKEEKPQVVILDYHLNSKLPDAADGIKVLDWIKKDSPETNVIMLTSNDNMDIAIKSFKHGASDYVVKTETQFMKINYSLLNLFKMVKAKSEAKRYKNVIRLFLYFIALQVAVIIAILIFVS